MADGPGGFDPNALLQKMYAQQQGQSGGIMDKVGNFLGHPVVQAALGTYLGAITSPRYMGLGGAIGRGGLLGLQEFGQARAMQGQQLKNLLAGMKDVSGIKKDTAEAGLAEKRGGLVGKQTAAYDANPDEADRYSLLAQNATNPLEQSILRTISEGRRKGTMTAYTAANTFDKIRSGDLKGAVDQANIDLAKQRTATSAEALKEMPGLTQAKEAEARARTSEAGAATAKDYAEAKRARQGPLGPEHPEYGPGGPNDVRFTHSPTSDPGYSFRDPNKLSSTPDEKMREKALSAFHQWQQSAATQWHGTDYANRAVSALTSVGVPPNVAADVVRGEGYTPSDTPAPDKMGPQSKVTLPSNISTTSAAVTYLTSKGMSRDQAIAYLRENHAPKG